MKSRTIDGVPCYTLREFAQLVERTPQTIRLLCRVGNAARKLKHVRIEDRIFIHASELNDFPFTERGTGKVVQNGTVRSK